MSRILQAASRLLGTLPVDEVTTSRIAEEAALSVGALYRFFPDKQSIVDAIAVRHIQEFRALMESRFQHSGPRFETGPDFLSALIDAFVEFLNTRPDFRAIAFSHVSSATRQKQTSPDAAGSGLLKRFMLESLGIADAARLDLRLRVAIEAGERILAFAYEHNAEPDRAAIINEAKTLLSGYLFA